MRRGRKVIVSSLCKRYIWWRATKSTMLSLLSGVINPAARYSDLLLESNV